MRIVRRIEFLKLPSGTLFSQAWTPWSFGDLHVKFDSLIHHENGDGDFVSMDFTSFDNDGTEQYFARLDEMAERGASYPLDLEAAGRDGVFERDAYFLVYEKEDVQKLSAFFARLAAET